MMNNIKRLRKEHNLSQIELAEKLHVHQTAISQWETGKTNPDYETLLKFTDIFDVSVDYLLGRTDDPSPQNKKGTTFDSEALELMEEMHKRPELKVLFDTSKNATKEDIEFVDEMLKRMAGRGDAD